MTGAHRLSAAAAFVFLGSLGCGTAALAVEPRQTTGQAASSTGAGQGDTSQPGVTQLNEGSACGTTGGSAAAGGAKAQGQTQQAAPSDCPAGEATGAKAQPGQAAAGTRDEVTGIVTQADKQAGWIVVDGQTYTLSQEGGGEVTLPAAGEKITFSYQERGGQRVITNRAGEAVIARATAG